MFKLIAKMLKLLALLIIFEILKLIILMTTKLSLSLYTFTFLLYFHIIVYTFFSQ